MDQPNAQYPDRTAEEVAWDDEFKARGNSNLASDLSDAARVAARMPGVVLSTVVPDETVRHARAAVRETFLALRSLLGSLADGIENVLAEPGMASSQPTVQGPPGTWGTGRSAQPAPGATKARRIEISEETSETTPQ